MSTEDEKGQGRLLVKNFSKSNILNALALVLLIFAVFGALGVYEMITEVLDPVIQDNPELSSDLSALIFAIVMFTGGEFIGYGLLAAFVLVVCLPSAILLRLSAIKASKSAVNG